LVSQGKGEVDNEEKNNDVPDRVGYDVRRKELVDSHIK
jgi:hypothetical protein